MDKRGMDKKKKIIIVLLIIAVLFSIFTLIVNSTVEDFELTNPPSRITRILQGKDNGNVNLVVGSVTGGKKT